jgi:RHH-type transcriptional regulator, proline utilization regulon repressor / proline dehydrogenase / delta 1-pyrroline-5-carboxylate dehydrogenase
MNSQCSPEPRRVRIPPLSAPFAPADEQIGEDLLRLAPRPNESERRIDALTRRLVEAIRTRLGGLGGIEDFLREYSLSTKEGLALMVLAEALLRVPDAATTDRLIEDKLAAADWAHHDVKSTAILVSASAWALGIGARIIHAGETPEGILTSVAKRLGMPALRAATRRAMRLLGSHFVLGETIEEALARARAQREFRFSFDMLGEGARTSADAERYFQAYAGAITAVAHEGEPDRFGISVKLSALHPRFEPISCRRVLVELAPKLLALAQAAKRHGLQLTVDAEEADRLELSLDVIGAVLADHSLAGWEGFGLAVQAYQKRALAVIDWVVDAARLLDRRLVVRLVKGAYWDTEIKRAQERGLDDYPVFTRKAVTDLCYMACMRKLIAAREHVFPQFATHNALTVATVIEEAQGTGGYEFQRLHGMGEALYETLLADEPGTVCRVYGPVGGHRDLLAYLVRRLLENGANSSFVSVAADPQIPIEAILERPQARIKGPSDLRHPQIRLPKNLYMPARRNSHGLELGERDAVDSLLRAIARDAPAATAGPVVNGTMLPGRIRPVISPIDGTGIGEVTEGDGAIVATAMAAARSGFRGWAARSQEERASLLDRAADALESARAHLISLLQREAGKTLEDALAEVREAVDFCRYYAAEARETLKPRCLFGPTGELDELRHRGRGAFVCISPFNFPLAIFIGQIAAALAAGNTVVAKPAEQTPLVAGEAVRIVHAAGVPSSALQLVPGGDEVGALLIEDERTSGVLFTGSNAAAAKIARALAAKDGPLVPFIAETGGINAMIVDATALPEQVTDDVLVSAFRSAGQRCSALRLLCLQEDVADQLLEMIEGAAQELAVGDPRDISTHVGPVIDRDAQLRLEHWIARTDRPGRIRFRWNRRPLPAAGTYVAPAIIELDRARDLDEEVFGPVLHVTRWRVDQLGELLDDIASTGFGLTLGIHSRIDLNVERIVQRLAIGNVYVNRSMIGAVVGTQPFGGSGRSGTGPKAGGPNYLTRLAMEQTVSVNTAAVGGNASLLADAD